MNAPSPAVGSRVERLCEMFSELPVDALLFEVVLPYGLVEVSRDSLAGLSEKQLRRVERALVRSTTMAVEHTRRNRSTSEATKRAVLDRELQRCWDVYQERNPDAQASTYGLATFEPAAIYNLPYCVIKAVFCSLCDDMNDWTRGRRIEAERLHGLGSLPHGAFVPSGVQRISADGIRVSNDWS